MKWFKRILLSIVTLYLLLCIVLYLIQDKLLFFPPRISATYKFDFKGRFREFNIDEGNGTVLNALQFYADTPGRGVVLYFHGNGEALDYTGTKAWEFTSRGYDCIMVDYPGYGKSTGTLSEETLFRTGMELMKKAREQYEPGRIIIYGRSLGTGIAAHTAREAVWFRSLLLEAPYYSVSDMAAHQYPWAPVALLCRYPITTNVFLKNIHKPVYAIHGTSDEVIPIMQARRLAASQPDNFNLTEVRGAGHNNLADFKEYDQWLDSVIK